VKCLDEDEFDIPLPSNDEVMLEVNPEHRMVVKENKYRRENRRLRNSLSFRTGTLLINSFKRPWMLLLLPFTLMFLGWQYGNERLGRRSVPYPDRSLDDHETRDSLRDCIVLFPTNGVGFGHFTRMYALAKRFRKQSPNTEIVFFTTMPTLQILYNEGFSTYHLAGRKKHREMTASEWNAMVEENLSLVLNQHKPKMFIFDGAFPYRGMLNAIRSRDRIEKVWVRRGMFRKGSNIPVDSIDHFTSIVRPGDGVDVDEHLEVEIPMQSHTVSPMLLMDHDELLTKQQAQSRLNLPEDSKIVYVQLGAGRINDIDSEIRLTVDALLKHEGVHVVIGESMLGERIFFEHPRVQLLRDYPNSMYFKAFDASIQAGGYNSFHEMRTFGLPTLFYPNMNTGMDDQLARCNISQSEGWGLVLKERTEASIEHSVEALLELEVPRVRPQLTNGAGELATLLLNKMRSAHG
jgi:UDP-N-acetylglucosamine--N-acetylmuramyl-(pentapeptide) pyrophosphoryl-undecaprenol N-acetylglucosamine transferase